jgi:hypothetical protein
MDSPMREYTGASRDWIGEWIALRMRVLHTRALAHPEAHRPVGLSNCKNPGIYAVFGPQAHESGGEGGDVSNGWHAWNEKPRLLDATLGGEICLSDAQAVE